MKRILFVLTIPVILFSCEREAAPPPVICKIATQQFTSSSQPVSTYTYSGNRITQVSNIYDTFNYTYDNTGNLTSIDKYIISTPAIEGRVTYAYTGTHLQSLTLYNSIGGTLRADYRVDYFYTNNLLSEKKLYDLSSGGPVYDGKTTYTWSGGNLVQYKEYTPMDLLDDTYDIAYDLAKPNTFANAFPDYYLIDLWGNTGEIEEAIFKSKNMLSTIQRAGYSIDHYTYTYNTNDLITSIRIGAAAPYCLFTYSCL